MDGPQYPHCNAGYWVASPLYRPLCMWGSMAVTARVALGLSERKSIVHEIKHIDARLALTAPTLPYWVASPLSSPLSRWSDASS